MPEEFQHLDIKELNQLFLELSRSYRKAIRAGLQPAELALLEAQLYQVYSVLRTRRFSYAPSFQRKAG
ncbi:MAG TPA: hypothetical protein VF145_12810 [Chitinophagaceae bacterium]